MHNKYDVVIIGSGIGGLVCGCYLAKAGIRTLIVEQHSVPGGYCTSFDRKGYRFDVGVHYLGGIRKGILERIIEELDLENEIQFKQFDPTDRIITRDGSVYIRAKSADTINEFKTKFPEEVDNIDRFFNFIAKEDFFKIYRKTRAISFKELLDSFFKNPVIKGVFNVLLRNLGLCAQEASALSSVVFLREYILDPGYYPAGGMQSFPSVLVKKFTGWGGDIVFSRKVDRILAKDNKINGIVLDDDEMIESTIVVSNADAIETFEELAQCESRELNVIKQLHISPSAFVVYLGLSQNSKAFIPESCSIWPFLTDDLDTAPILTKTDIISGDVFVTMISFPSCHDSLSDSNKATVGLFSVVSFEEKSFWNEYKEKLAEKLIVKAEEIIPSLRKFIDVKVIATPSTFYKYTLNTNGAAFGWASEVNQVTAKVFPQVTSINGLFLVGHWCTVGSGQGGIPKVAFAGRKGAILIFRQLEIEWRFGEYLL